MMKGSARLFLATSLFAIAAAVQAGETVTYSYDALGRLTANSSIGTVNDGVTSSIGYDAAGNRSIYAMSVSGAPSFSVGEAATAEGGGLVFTVVKNGTGAASVSYSTANISAAGGADYGVASGSLSFAAGESSKTVSIASIDDSGDEPSETLSLNLSGPSAGASIADAQGIGMIFDNDEPPPPPPPPPPSFSINDISLAEGGLMEFTVTKTGAAVDVFYVDFATANGTALGSYNGGDYYTAISRLYFGAADTSKKIFVQTYDDIDDEPNETFSVTLSGPSGGASITDSQGTGTIVDNDDPPPPPPPGNTPPTPVNDSGSQKLCTTKTYNVLANDTDPDGNYPLTLIASSHPSFAIVGNQIEVESSNLSSGDFTTYTVRDAGNATATATLTVTITSGNCNQ